MNIDNLPDALLVEILCRLACNTLVFQCKCVSKRWFNLISIPYFIGRYLRLQRDLQTPILTTLVLFDLFRPSEVFLTSKHPVFETRSRNFSLGFLPCYQDLEKLAKSMAWPLPIPLEPGSLVPPVVVASYKDLVLCCASTTNQRDYFICNPFTKQWAALPPTPRVYPSGSGDHNIAKCRFIQLPKGLNVQGHSHLVINGGRLHFCKFVLVDDNDDGSDLPAFRVWELKQVVEHRGKFKWLADRVSLTSEDENAHLIKSKMCRSFWVVAFLPNNEDIVYLQWRPNIFTCNLRRGKLEIIEKTQYTGALNRLYPLVFPWWPTPVPTL